MPSWWNPTANLYYLIRNQQSREFRTSSPRQTHRRHSEQLVISSRSGSANQNVASSGFEAWSVQLDEQTLAAIERQLLIRRVTQMQEDTWQMATRLWNLCQNLQAQLTSLRTERYVMEATYEDLMEQGDELHDTANIATVHEMLLETGRRWTDANCEVQEVKRQFCDYWNLYRQTEVLYFENTALLIEALFGEARRGPSTPDDSIES